jgi:hypothetical protein
MTAAISARSPAHITVASKRPREKMRTLIVSWDGSADCADLLATIPVAHYDVPDATLLEAAGE